jgi:ubiquinone/menaquinone biosynthesis C-methylase UbiE
LAYEAVVLQAQRATTLESVKEYYDRSADALERRKLRCVLDAVETDSIVESLSSYSGPVLDVGCGSGHLLDRLEASIKIGIDLSTSMLRLARKRGCRALLILADATRLPIKSESFEIVVSQDMLGHFRRPSQPVDEMVRVCRPGGRLLATTSRRSLFSRLVELYSRIWLGVYVRSYSQDEVEKIFEASGARCLTKESIGSSVVKILATPPSRSKGSD